MDGSRGFRGAGRAGFRSEGRGASPREGRQPLDLTRARGVALQLLSRKGWTRRDLVARLQRRGAPAEVAEAVVADLEALGYVDDRAFAAAWVESRAGGRGLGPRRLREELFARGVDRAVVEAALAGAGSEMDEEARVRALAARRLPAIRRAAPDRVARRLHDYLLRRGFPAGVVRRVVESACRTALPGDDPDG